MLLPDQTQDRVGQGTPPANCSAAFFIGSHERTEPGRDDEIFAVVKASDAIPGARPTHPAEKAADSVAGERAQGAD